ncbi:hypothetical protein HYT01_00650 [Candidatus Giovannonibacteria bacterium]|nr:hypothetical protein [Candidatus Giovannonibacteria bacterium]
MGFFGQKKVSDREFKKVTNELSQKGLSKQDLRDVKNVFRGDLGEEGFRHGIDKKELEKEISYMEKHPSQHHLSKDQLEQVKKSLEKRM